MKNLQPALLHRFKMSFLLCLRETYDMFKRYDTMYGVQDSQLFPIINN